MKLTNNSTGELRPATGQSKQKKSTVRFLVRELRAQGYRPESQAEIAERQRKADEVARELRARGFFGREEA